MPSLFQNAGSTSISTLRDEASSGEGDAMDGVLHPWESPEVLNPLLEALDQDRRPWYKKAFSWVVGKVTFSSAKDHHANGYVRI